MGYCRANETDKALGLWNLLQEEGEVPSDAFLSYLGKHLESQNRDVPFVIPKEENAVKKSKKSQDVQIASATKISNRNVKIEELVKQGNLEEACKLTLKSLNEGARPNKNVISFFLKKLSQAGNVDNILLLKPYYENEGKPINYRHKLNLAMVVNGSAEKLIDELTQSLKTAQTTNDFENLAKMFPRAEALNNIVKNEVLADKCKYFINGIH